MVTVAKALVIVESPAKAKTINKYLGKQYVVMASLGHVKDLPKKDLAVDVDNGFEPLYVVSPGRCYRQDPLDATHSPVFHQIEGLAVDEGLTMADLRGAIQSFVDAMFGVGLRTRFRPDYFPFTEPSGDVSMECHICRGASAKPGGDPCRVCRSQGWIEIAGCGMVNPRVLVACGIDPDRYSGFAFGLGIERSLMIGHGLTEIRDAVEGDVRFSRAFGMEI